MSNELDGPTHALLLEIRDGVRQVRERVDILGGLAALSAQVATIGTKLDTVITKEDAIMAGLDDLTADVAAEDTVIDSAVVLIQGFAAQLAAAGVDPAKLSALRADIQAKTQALAAAVAANTPPPVVPPTA